MSNSFYSGFEQTQRMANRIKACSVDREVAEREGVGAPFFLKGYRSPISEPPMDGMKDLTGPGRSN